MKAVAEKPIPPARKEIASPPATMLEHLAAVPEEEIWLSKQKSARTRRAYRLDVAHFVRTIDITSAGELRQADHKAVIAWERIIRERDDAAPSTIRRRLAALSPLFKHLVRHGHAARNPVTEVERPAINRDEGSTLAFSKAQARKILDAPAEDTVAGLHDRAILSVGLQVGLRRAEIAALSVGDLHQNHGYDSLRVVRKGGRRDALAINPQTAARLRAYLEAQGMASGARSAGAWTPTRSTASYASFITTALENGAQLEDVQKAAGHRSGRNSGPSASRPPRL
jgi:site-specific recombinase XerD